MIKPLTDEALSKRARAAIEDLADALTMFDTGRNFRKIKPDADVGLLIEEGRRKLLELLSKPALAPEA